MSGRPVAVLGLVALGAYATLVTSLGGGVDDPAGGQCVAGSTDHCNPEVGILHIGGEKRCVTMQGPVYKPAVCGTPEAIPETEGSAGEFGGTGGGASLSYADVKRLWIAAGGDPGTANVAAAVATAESGRRPGAVNASNSNGSIDRGLFQINSVHGANSTFNLDANVAYAVQLQRGQGWRPWVAYTSGAYSKYVEA